MEREREREPLLERMSSGGTAPWRRIASYRDTQRRRRKKERKRERETKRKTYVSVYVGSLSAIL